MHRYDEFNIYKAWMIFTQVNNIHYLDWDRFLRWFSSEYLEYNAQDIDELNEFLYDDDGWRLWHRKYLER